METTANGARRATAGGIVVWVPIAGATCALEAVVALTRNVVMDARTGLLGTWGSTTIGPGARVPVRERATPNQGKLVKARALPLANIWVRHVLDIRAPIGPATIAVTGARGRWVRATGNQAVSVHPQAPATLNPESHVLTGILRTMWVRVITAAGRCVPEPVARTPKLELPAAMAPHGLLRWGTVGWVLPALVQERPTLKVELGAPMAPRGTWIRGTIAPGRSVLAMAQQTRKPVPLAPTVALCGMWALDTIVLVFGAVAQQPATRKHAPSVRTALRTMWVQATIVGRRPALVRAHRTSRPELSALVAVPLGSVNSTIGGRELPARAGQTETLSSACRASRPCPLDIIWPLSVSEGPRSKTGEWLNARAGQTGTVGATPGASRAASCVMAWAARTPRSALLVALPVPLTTTWERIAPAPTLMTAHAFHAVLTAMRNSSRGEWATVWILKPAMGVGPGTELVCPRFGRVGLSIMWTKRH